jgi:hypothetical protein
MAVLVLRPMMGASEMGMSGEGWAFIRSQKSKVESQKSKIQSLAPKTPRLKVFKVELAAREHRNVPLRLSLGGRVERTLAEPGQGTGMETRNVVPWWASLVKSMNPLWS